MRLSPVFNHAISKKTHIDVVTKKKCTLHHHRFVFVVFIFNHSLSVMQQNPAGVVADVILTKTN